MEKTRLVADYGAAVAAYYAAVGEFEQGLIIGSHQVYENQYRATEAARLECEGKRKVLEEHVAGHGC